MSFLSICIPTFNRAEKVDNFLSLCADVLAASSVEVYISDNASNDQTASIVKSYQAKFANIHYVCNEKNEGFLYNFEQALTMSEADYVWLMGDDDLLELPNLPIVMEKLRRYRPGLMVVNGGDKQSSKIVCRCHRPSALYTDKNAVLSELGAHMSWMSSLIFSRKLRQGLSLQPYTWTPFPHLMYIFDALAKGDFTVYYEAKPCVYYNSMGSSGGYADKTIEYFAKDWCDMSAYLTAYSPEARETFKYLHRDTIGNTSVGAFLKLRMLGYYNWPIFKKYKTYLPAMTTIPIGGLALIALAPSMPQWLYHILRKMKHTSRYVRNHL